MEATQLLSSLQPPCLSQETPGSPAIRPLRYQKKWLDNPATAATPQQTRTTRQPTDVDVEQLDSNLCPILMAAQKRKSIDPPSQPRKPKRKRADPPSSPPPDLILDPEANGHVSTPTRAGILGARLFARQHGLKCTEPLLSKTFNVPLRTVTRVCASKQVHTRYNKPDSGPDPRGRLRKLTRQETATVGTYLDAAPLEEASAHWHDVFHEAGVDKVDTQQISVSTLRRSMRIDENIRACKAAKKDSLPPRICKARLAWVDKMLSLRPHSKDWENVWFCDEIHFRLGKTSTKWVKRRPGQRYKANKIQREKDITTEDSELRMLNAWIVLGYNYKRYILYLNINIFSNKLIYMLGLYIIPSRIKSGK